MCYVTFNYYLNLYAVFLKLVATRYCSFDNFLVLNDVNYKFSLSKIKELTNNIMAQGIVYHLLSIHFITYLYTFPYVS